MRELDHLQIELSGKNLIEASAGTGKTYAISSLYLRLVIEQGLTPEQILVVTYTEAATEELRGRIRGRIREGLDVFAGKGTEDAFLAGLRENENGRGPGKEVAIQRLDLALKAFDTASIFTIHGFCGRALQDNAFETGSLYDMELVPDQDKLFQQVVDDFWRKRFFTTPAPLLAHALQKKWTPETLVRFVKKVPAHSRMKVVPAYSEPEIITLEERCTSAFARIAAQWPMVGAEIRQLLTTDKGLGRGVKDYKQDLLPLLLASMDAFAVGDNPFNLFDGFHKFTTDGVTKGTKPTGIAPRHPFFDLCGELHAAVEERFLALRWELVEFCRRYLPLRKRELNVRAFDDLIHDVHAALEGENGPSFARSLGNRYRAALIDEFQDTDPVQYDIFRTIHDVSGSCLFLIGDPKQAIYSFRGADIFAYLEAASGIPDSNRFTLTANWRSTKPLLDAFNALFDNVRKPFLFEQIAYHPLKPGRMEEGGMLPLCTPSGAPLQVWSVSSEGTVPSVGEAHDIIPDAVAAETARLLRQGLQGQAGFGSRTVSPSDIAVIVRSHRQAGLIQRALQTYGTPCVMRSDKSIFGTDEAREVLMLLSALATPGDETRLRSALVTDILGRTAEDLVYLQENEQAWEECLERFRDYHQLWIGDGFMAMSQCLLARENVRGRLLRRPDGERRLTNLLHCFEIIHCAGHDSGLGLEGVLAWFAEKVGNQDGAEEYQIRLETDENAVRIVTVHVSKGLEYPVVFVPFMWGGTRVDDGVITCHDGFTMIKDFGSPDFEVHRKRSERECLAENLRLLYVAVTRAKSRCYLVGGKIAGKTDRNRPDTSPLAYLLHASDETRNATDTLRRLADEVGAHSAGTINQQLEQLKLAAGGGVTVGPLPDSGDSSSLVTGADQGAVECRRFSGQIRTEWRVASFTAFANHEPTVAEHPDRDQHAAANLTLVEETGGRSIFTFPRGARAGTFLHQVFECLDFSSHGPGAADPTVKALLEKQGYGLEWLSSISTMIDRVLATPLSCPGGDFCLGQLQKGSWITELEFFFPLKFITATVLRDCLGTLGDPYAPEDILQLCRALSFKPVEGMVRGFIDMVFEHEGKFYIIDWKSNHLGYRCEDYGSTQLRQEVVRNLYTLQYLLYTVALDRYLSLRIKNYDYERCFGGVIYIFLRGVSPEHGEEYGIFRDLPPVETIRRLTRCLIEMGG